VLVDCQWPVARIAVGLGDIAEVHATSPSEIMVEGKTIGETSLIVWDTHGGRQFFNVTVRASSAGLNDSLDSIRRELRLELPGENLKVTSENGSIFLRGTVKDLNGSARAVRIASMGGKVVNLLNVDVPASEPQILLKVRFMSVDRGKDTKLCWNLYNLGAGNFIGGVSTGQCSQPALAFSGSASATTVTTSNTLGLNLSGFYPGLGIGATIQDEEDRTLSETLAEPNLIAANGKEASFLAGGEYPYPMVQPGSGGSGASVTIAFKEYGIRLNFIPTITPRGTIRLQVAPEVSALDFGDEVDVDGTVVPAITVRRVNTEVELAEGQSFVIGGLLNNTESDTFQKIPFLGDIPILGNFFKSMEKKKANNELIVIVTPEIVSPIQAGDPVPSLKFPAKFLPPNSGIPMSNPDAKTAANTPAPAPPTMPVEKLIDSMKPETPLVISGGSSFGGGSTMPTGNAPSIPSTQP